MKRFLTISTTVGVLGFIFLVQAYAVKEDKITVCHATSSDTNPYEQIVVSANAIGGHFDNPGTPKAGHEDDLLFEGEVDCPTPSVTPTEEPTPTEEVTPTVTPEVTATPSATTVSAQDDPNSCVRKDCSIRVENKTIVPAEAPATGRAE